jgi:acetyl esterase/lipase
MNTEMKSSFKILIFNVFVFLAASSLRARGPDSILYKTVGTDSLYMQVDYPMAYDASKSYPAMVFFFGGGWNGGSTGQFEPHAKYFASRGMICFRADYRVKSRQGTSPFESLKDAKSAIRYIRAHAPELGVDQDKIIASGGSAGGHLAAATAVIQGFNEMGEDLTVSCIPNALVLFNPVFDNGPGGYGYERIGEAYKEFSPLHNIREGMPPAAIFLGTEDHLIPVETARYFETVMKKVGSRCELFLYEGEGHGFFNYRNYEIYQDTRDKADVFLISTGFLRDNNNYRMGYPLKKPSVAGEGLK